jgi:hypothetical protein
MDVRNIRRFLGWKSLHVLAGLQFAHTFGHAAGVFAFFATTQQQACRGLQVCVDDCPLDRQHFHNAGPERRCQLESPNTERKQSRKAA